MAAPSCTTCRKYLLHFAHEHLEFRLPELHSIYNLLNLVPPNDHNDYDNESPYMVVELPSETCARNLMSRAVLIKSVYELWGQGKTYEELLESIRKFPAKYKEPFCGQETSFKVKHDSFNKILTFQDKLQRIEGVLDEDVLPLQGPVDLKNPAQTFYLLEYYGRQHSGTSNQPTMVYFGRWVADGQREYIQTYHLQKRKFIGNTSMEAGLSMIMANMGGVRPADLVFDPFVGTGSLLVACAHFGSYVMGTDIDYKIIHGQGKASRRGQKWREPDESIRTNLKQYNLAKFYIDAMVADTAKHALWRQQPIFDAIITDPPYGIREQTKKLGSKSTIEEVPEEFKGAHIPCKTSYALSDIVKDLLNFAARSLRLHGRLVYWLPVYRPDYVEDNVPRHPCLEVVANSEQVLNTRIGRRLITMQKVRNYQEEEFSNGAEVIEDHYRDYSFREKYFRPPPGEKDERPPKSMGCVQEDLNTLTLSENIDRTKNSGASSNSNSQETDLHDVR